uniref:Ribonuclease P/MRP subunit p21 n=1 Tax=Naja naja TaxID=35670 RepID=A0A8C6V5F4_NAJNA
EEGGVIRMFLFLTQAAHCVLAQNPNNQELARFYCHTQNNISRRLVLRQDPSVKRTICKSCFSLLIPGVSSTVRQRKRRHQRRTVVQCLNCGLSKRFPSKPDYKLWSEQPEALLENQAPAGAGTKGKPMQGRLWKEKSCWEWREKVVLSLCLKVPLEQPQLPQS